MKLISTRWVADATLAAVVLGALVACGSEAGTATDSPTPPSGGSAAPATAEIPEDACSAVTAEEVSTAVGGQVTLSTGPSGDCEFSQEDPRALRGSIGFVDDAASNGGFAAYVAGLGMSLKEPSEHPISGLGDAASVYVGPPAYGGGESLGAFGAVDRGTFLVQASLTQANGLGEDFLAAATERLLRLLSGAIS